MTIQTLETLPQNPVSSAGCDLPPAFETQSFTDARQAVAALKALYERNTGWLREHFEAISRGDTPGNRVRAFYPQLEFETESYSHVDSRLAYGHVVAPGRYTGTISRPDLFADYLETQIALIMRNHGVPVKVGESDTPIPLHFAFLEGTYIEQANADALMRPLRDTFDVPDLNTTNDDIVNGNFEPEPGHPLPLAPFTAQRVDYSLHRLAHYTATSPSHFQNFVLFTNYQFYIDEFCQYARDIVAKGEGGYTAFVEPGNLATPSGEKSPASGVVPARLPQMPAYHLMKDDRTASPMVNIGVGPSNAKTITDHIAVLRPHAWLMLGHCAGACATRRTSAITFSPTPMCARTMSSTTTCRSPCRCRRWPRCRWRWNRRVAEVTGYTGYELKKIMRTGTVATIDNRNWELREQRGPVRRLSQSRAIALDMESATIAANGFRFRVPYGTLLCVSDKPLHGELKLPGMATDFYKRQVSQHLIIGIKAMEKLAQMPPERLHSRKLRSFNETAFQ